MRSRTGAIFLSVMAVVVFAVPAVATTPDEVIFEGGVFVAPDAADVEAGELRVLVDEAESLDLELRIVVLGDEEVDAPGFAESVAAVSGGTVLVFTDTAYGAFSADLSQDEMDAALTSAGGELAGADVAEGVEAFIEGATHEGTNWGLVTAGVVLLVLVVGIGGRYYERRLSGSRRQRALTREHTKLIKRADLLADPMIELSTKVDLSDSPEAAERYREASELYARIRSDLDLAPATDLVDSVASNLDKLDDKLRDVEMSLTQSGQ